MDAMVGRWFYLLAVGIGVIAYVNAPWSGVSADIEQSCDPGGAVSVTMTWPAPDEGALETWVDLSLTDAFTPGAYASHGPFDPARVEYAISGVPADVTYHYRVNTRYGETWRTTASGEFVSGCNTDDGGIASVVQIFE
jgi:hypothetical protein